MHARHSKKQKNIQKNIRLKRTGHLFLACICINEFSTKVSKLISQSQEMWKYAFTLKCNSWNDTVCGKANFKNIIKAKRSIGNICRLHCSLPGFPPKIDYHFPWGFQVFQTMKGNFPEYIFMHMAIKKYSISLPLNCCHHRNCKKFN